MQLSQGLWLITYELDGGAVDSCGDAADVSRGVGVLGYLGGARSPSWHERAICQGIDSEVFFGTESTAPGPTLNQSQIRRAQEICDQCPVARECLTHALTKPEQYGIWAGTSGNQREKLVRAIKTEGLQIPAVVDAYLRES